MGSLSLLQGSFPTQGSNTGLPLCRWILYQLSHKRGQQVWNLDLEKLKAASVIRMWRGRAGAWRMWRRDWPQLTGLVKCSLKLTLGFSNIAELQWASLFGGVVRQQPQKSRWRVIQQMKRWMWWEWTPFWEVWLWKRELGGDEIGWCSFLFLMRKDRVKRQRLKTWEREGRGFSPVEILVEAQVRSASWGTIEVRDVEHM